MKKPESVNILGKEYKIEYCDKPSDVDIFRRESLWGQIDYWTRTIRIYFGKGHTLADVWHTLIHEILHGLAQELHLKELDKKENHDELDLLALGFSDMLVRNDWLGIERK